MVVSQVEAAKICLTEKTSRCNKIVCLADVSWRNYFASVLVSKDYKFDECPTKKDVLMDKSKILFMKMYAMQKFDDKI